MQCIPLLSNEEAIARYYAKIAVRSLYNEVALYPKPGLVSFVDSGVHGDMDGKLFFKSLLGLRHYFYQISLHAIRGFPKSSLVDLGKEAEKKMFEITGGVNTHKGAIFSLGILSATIAELTSRKETFTPKELQEAIVENWARYLPCHRVSENSHGQIVKNQYKISGALEMAILGYKPIFTIFHELSTLQITDRRLYGLLAFKALLLQIDDTNILYRAGMEGLQFARGALKKIIFPHDKEKAICEGIELHREFVARNLSPGGVADMLGMIYFLHEVFEEAFE